LNIAIEIVDLPTKNGDFPSFSVKVYQRVVLDTVDTHGDDDIPETST